MNYLLKIGEDVVGLLKGNQMLEKIFREEIGLDARIKLADVQNEFIALQDSNLYKRLGNCQYIPVEKRPDYEPEEDSFFRPNSGPTRTSRATMRFFRTLGVLVLLLCGGKWLFAFAKGLEEGDLSGFIGVDSSCWVYQLVIAFIFWLALITENIGAIRESFEQRKS
jgi:hypothetical protein